MKYRNRIIYKNVIEVDQRILAMWTDLLRSTDVDYSKYKFGKYECLESYSSTFPDGYEVDININANEPSSKSIYSEAILFNEDGCEVYHTDCSDKIRGVWTFTRVDNNGVLIVYKLRIASAHNETFLAEEYCGECDEIVHVVFNAEDFWNHKVGKIKCDECGEGVLPCNTCGGYGPNGEKYDCDKCPWKKCEAIKAMTDKEYVLYCKKNEPANYEIMKGDSNGDYYHNIIKEIENGEKCEDKCLDKVLEKMKDLGYVLYDTTDSFIIFRNQNDLEILYDKLIQFSSWDDVKKFAKM